ncbi:MAG: ABC transporter permease [Pseudomonadota bacterium]
MKLWILAWKSLLNRKSTALLTLLAIAVSVALLMGVEKIRVGAKDNFASTVSGTDLIVGARSGSVQLLLYSVFRIGNATNNISWESYQEIASFKEIKWTIPISLGDSHRGYRVMGTSKDYFEYFRYGSKQKLSLEQGSEFEKPLETVLGAEVARALNYRLGQKIIVSHGIGTTGIADHDDSPFVITGILKPTGTPVDRTIHVSLEGIEAMHKNMNRLQSANSRERIKLNTPTSITAFMVGLDNRMTAFRLQRKINNYQSEPLLAIFPGVALHELWGIMSVAESALLAVSVLVVVAALVGLLAVSLAGLGERRREMAVLRSVGAGYRHIAGLLIAESTLLTMIGILTGLVMQNLILLLGQGYLISEFGVYLPLEWPSGSEWQMLFVLLAAGILVGVVPAYRGYRNSLLDGLSTRL